MVWQKEIDELNRRLEMASKMGGEVGVSRQHENGKLTVRERVYALADPGSFKELSALAGSAAYENNELVDFLPYPRVIGTSKINGLRVLLDGGDFTVRGGAGERGLGSKPSALKYATQWRLPLVRLLDAVGGSVRTFEQLGRTYLPDSPGTSLAVELLNQVPVVSAVMGSVAGLPAIEACLCHFNVMVKDTSQVFAGGPPVVKAALGYNITKEELGDHRSQVFTAGVIDNLADSEEEAFEMIRKFLSFMPSNVWKKPERIETDDDPERRDEGLLSIIPRNPRRSYDPRKILEHVLDRDSFFEIAPHHGRARNDQQPQPLGRFNRRRGRRKGDAPLEPVRYLPPARGLFRGRAWFHGGHGRAERRHRESGRKDGRSAVPESESLDKLLHEAGLRCCRTDAPPPHRHVPSLRMAVRQVGVYAHRRRRFGGVSKRHRHFGRPRSAPSGN